MSNRPSTRVRQFGVQRCLKVSLTAAITIVAVVALTGLASASSPPALGIARNVTVKGTTKNVVVNSRSVTVYTLSGERRHHLECTKANNCFAFWFPVKAASARAHLTAAQGVKGKLGKLHRNGFVQITLGGRPLYTFIGDAGRRRSATGEAIPSFGGIWHVVAVASSSGSANPPATTTTGTTTSPPYQY